MTAHRAQDPDLPVPSRPAGTAPARRIECRLPVVGSGAAPRMVAFFEDNTALQFEGGLTIPDAYGAGAGGRPVIAAPYDARGLGKLVRRLRVPLRETTFWGMTIQAGPDLHASMTMTRSPRAFRHAAGRVSRHLLDLARHRRRMQLRNGLVLAGRLLRDGKAVCGAAMTFGFIAGRRAAGMAP